MKFNIAKCEMYVLSIFRVLLAKFSFGFVFYGSLGLYISFNKANNYSLSNTSVKRVIFIDTIVYKRNYEFKVIFLVVEFIVKYV